MPAAEGHAEGHAEADREWDELHEDEVVGELGIPGLAPRARLAKRGETGGDRGGETPEGDEPARHALPLAGLPSNVWNARSWPHVWRSAAGASRHRWSLLMIP